METVEMSKSAETRRYAQGQQGRTPRLWERDRKLADALFIRCMFGRGRLQFTREKLLRGSPFTTSRGSNHDQRGPAWGALAWSGLRTGNNMRAHALIRTRCGSVSAASATMSQRTESVSSAG